MDRIEAFVEQLLPSLGEIMERAVPGSRVVEVVPLSPDQDQADETLKVAGYGVPLRVRIEGPGGIARTLVLHTATSNVFGHDRRSDRAAEMLLGFDTFGSIPRHVRALDVGAFRVSGGLVSLRDAGEFYLLTSYAEGQIYAEDLRRISRELRHTPEDEERADGLVSYLVSLHSERRGDPQVYRRSVRDLVGSGEGIAGIIDGYPDDVPRAPLARLARIFEACNRWRWKLRAHEHRCRRIHGDFHPWNVVFDRDKEPCLLDASRGSAGDPADDVACMAMNYLFFAVEHPAAWAPSFSGLWRRFWSTYTQRSGDGALFDLVAPFLAWRGLVVSNPAWYPAVSEEARDSLLTFIEAALEAPRFAPAMADDVFR